MSSSIWARVRSSLILLTLMLSLALVPQLMRATPVAASPATVTLCGVVSGYVAPTSTNTGSITIGGGTPFVIATTPTFTGFTGSAAGSVANGNTLCFVLTLNASNQIIAGSVTPNNTSYLTLCGVVFNYTPASSTPGGTQGSITIGGTQTFTIVSGMVFSGPAAAAVANGANLCFQLTLNGANQIVAGYVTPSGAPSPGVGPFQICGLVTAFIPAGTTAGSVIVNGMTFPIVAGTVGTGVVVVPGFSFCFIFTFNTANQVIAFSVSPNLAIGVAFVCGVFTVFTPALGTVPATIIIGGFPFVVNTTVFVPTFIPTNTVVCFLLAPNGVVIGFLSGVPTLAVPVEHSGSTHRVGRLLAQ